MLTWTRRLAVLLALGCGLSWFTVVPAGAQITASLHPSLTPERLGHGTTIGFSFELSTTDGVAPPPLAQVDLSMPAGLNYGSTALGLAICQTEVLRRSGPSGCPANSRLGVGSAFVEVPFGTESGRELPDVQAFMGPPHNENIVVLFYAQGLTPVYAGILFTGELVPEGGMFGSALRTSIPLIPSVPNGPDVSIIRVSTTIGPAHLVYYHRVHGKLRRFHPAGVALPFHCPRGGFPFSANFTFLEGAKAQASASVPCPAPGSASGKKKPRKR